MDQITALIAAIAAGVATIAAISARRDARAIRDASRRRSEGRSAVGHALDVGNELLNDLHRQLAVPQDKGAEAPLRDQFVEWQALAREAIRSADPAQLPRFDAPNDVGPSAAAVTRVLLARLQEIQDRL